MPISNASLLDEDFSAIDDWTNGDQAPATSTQETFDGEETLCQDTNGSAAGNDYAYVYRDVGSLDGLGNTIVISIRMYIDLIGTLADTDVVVLHFRRSDWRLEVVFASDGLYISDGVDYNEVGVNLVQQDTWQEWTFVCDLSGGAANATCDVYLDDSLEGNDIDCSEALPFTDGLIDIYTLGYVTDNCIAYFDWLKIGDGVVTSTIISDSVINISDTFKNLDSIKINIGDSWKDVTAAYINIGDTWKKIF